ncbi:hypothetical protein [Shewanella sp. BF02_Schw]|nr:hypothetical protein [Shewanella sp. BF02_Schw]
MDLIKKGVIALVICILAAVLLTPLVQKAVEQTDEINAPRLITE